MREVVSEYGELSLSFLRVIVILTVGTLGRVRVVSDDVLLVRVDR